MEIQLTLSINFISSKDFDETRNMYTNSDNIEIFHFLKFPLEIFHYTKKIGKVLMKQ